MGRVYGLDVVEEPDAEAEAVKEGKCPKCGATLAMDSVLAVRQVLDLTVVIKCSVSASMSASMAWSTGPPG